MEENKLMEIQRELMVCNKPSVYLEKIKNSFKSLIITVLSISAANLKSSVVTIASENSYLILKFLLKNLFNI